MQAAQASGQPGAQQFPVELESAQKLASQAKAAEESDQASAIYLGFPLFMVCGVHPHQYGRLVPASCQLA